MGHDMTLSPWSHGQEIVLAGVASVSSTLSLFAGLVVACSVLLLTVYHWTTREARYLQLRVEKEMGIQELHLYRKMTMKKSQLRRMVFGLITADCIFAATKLSSCMKVLAGSGVHTGVFCSLSAIVQDTAALTTALYVVEISLVMNAFAAMWAPKLNDRIRYAIEIGGHFAAWLLPIFPAILPLFREVNSDYVPGGAWCFISPDPWYSRFLLFYIWVWVAIAIIVLNYVVLIVILVRYVLGAKAHLRKVTHRKTRSVILQFCMIPLVFMILWTPATLNRISENAGSNLFWLAAVEAASLPLQGLLDCMLYGYMTVYMDVRTAMKRVFRKQIKDAGGAHLLTDEEADYYTPTRTGGSHRMSVQ